MKLEPGKFYTATVDGKEVRGFASKSALHYPTGESWQFVGSGRVTDARPLVLIDLSSLLTTGPLIADLRDCGYLGIAEQIEAQTRPPRIPEPGWGAIVEASGLGAKGQRIRWVKGDKGWTNLDAEGEYLNWTSWAALVDPTLIRDGVES